MGIWNRSCSGTSTAGRCSVQISWQSMTTEMRAATSWVTLNKCLIWVLGQLLVAEDRREHRPGKLHNPKAIRMKLWVWQQGNLPHWFSTEKSDDTMWSHKPRPRPCGSKIKLWLESTVGDLTDIRWGATARCDAYAGRTALQSGSGLTWSGRWRSWHSWAWRILLAFLLKFNTYEHINGEMLRN